MFYVLPPTNNEYTTYRTTTTLYYVLVPSMLMLDAQEKIVDIMIEHQRILSRILIYFLDCILIEYLICISVGVVLEWKGLIECRNNVGVIIYVDVLLVDEEFSIQAHLLFQSAQIMACRPRVDGRLTGSQKAKERRG